MKTVHLQKMFKQIQRPVRCFLHQPFVHQRVLTRVPIKGQKDPRQPSVSLQHQRYYQTVQPGTLRKVDSPFIPRPLPIVTPSSRHSQAYLTEVLAGTKVLLFSNASNVMTKRVEGELKGFGVQITTRLPKGRRDMLRAVEEVDHDIIICPFLTRRVPEEIWANPDKPCLIVHPGIAGDRGASSLDWAIRTGAPEWGVTVLSAAEEMDAGDIWATKTFPISQESSQSKTGLYVNEVISAAAQAVLHAVVQFKLSVPPVPLHYDHPEIKGSLMPLMRDDDRWVDFSEPAHNVVKSIQMSDTQPGSLGRLTGDDRVLRLYGAHPGESTIAECHNVRAMMSEAKPGDVLGQKDGAILVRCGDNNALWISHLKSAEADKAIKLPASKVYDGIDNVPELSHVKSYGEIRTEVKDRVAYLHFDFYNGAMSVSQCQRLTSAISRLAIRKDIEVIALMGGSRFFSTGIHLNMIEASDDPVGESYDNIVAIDDVIKEFVGIMDKVVVSCLQGAAGAGGCMMAAATDMVYAHKGVSFAPSYKSMALFGSEYWTYFFPRRVGEKHALRLTDGTDSMMAAEAETIGLVDKVIGWDRKEMLTKIHDELQDLTRSGRAQMIISEKLRRPRDWHVTIEEHREMELEKMKQCFKSEEYNEARRKFVYH